MTEISPMVRTALFVADLPASRQFYEQILGLQECWFEGELTEGNAHQLLGMPAGTHTRACILKAPGPAWGMVGLFEITQPQPPRLSRELGSINQGETCLVFYCADFAATGADGTDGCRAGCNGRDSRRSDARPGPRSCGASI